VGFIGAARDITDRKRGEEGLRESEERFRQIGRHSTNVLWVLNAGSQFGAVERALHGEVVVEEYRIVRPDGTVHRIHDTFFPMLDGQQRIGSIKQDLTSEASSLLYVVDAQEASRQGLAQLFRSAGYDVKAFASAAAFLEVATVLVAGCVVLDSRGPAAGGLTIPRDLKARRTPMPVVLIGDAGGDVRFGAAAIKAGATDFLPVPYEKDELLRAVATAVADSHTEAEQDQAAQIARTRLAEVSPREREVLQGLLAGKTNKQIGREIGISPRTVEVHRARLMERLEAKSLSNLVLSAYRAGVLPG
jgi:RNA polymerase sigma factor (sigma-70 family)